MEQINKRKTVNIFLGFLLALSICCVCNGQKLCTVSSDAVFIQENSTVDLLVAKINSSEDVTLTLTENPEDSFYLKGSELWAVKGLDYETLPSVDSFFVRVRCNRTGSRSVNVSIEVFVENVNDNPPNFAQDHYVLNVNELSPVNSSVGLIEATDIDSDLLYYRLESAMDRYFRLENVNTPKILVQNILDYDAIQKISLVLHVQDTYNGSASSDPFFTSVTTITVNVKDIDNRPPWFQPCVRTNIGPAKLCISTGYRGKVNLTEREDGPLALEPGPVYAKDGDRNRSEQISYRIFRGNEGNIFQIDEETGNITMAKAADIVGLITLTVLAFQVTNRDQFSITAVTFEVMKKSRNPPRFEKDRYEGFIYSNSVPESMILRDRTSNRPFRVKARDEDFATGINPDVKYEVQYSSYVNVTAEGFVILKRIVKTESFALQLRAVDISTGEFGTTALSVQVIPAVAVPSPSGAGYRAGDMALLGLIMAAVLVLCLIVIGFLISRLRKGNTSFHKLSECLGPCLRFVQPQGQPKDNTQYTNDGFQTEGDSGRGGSRRVETASPRRTLPPARDRVIPMEQRSRHCASCGVHANHVGKARPASFSGRGARQGEEYGVRSILSKERKRDERQKTVWFKENEESSEIEVEIIPDSPGQEEKAADELDEEEMEGGGESMAAQQTDEGDEKEEVSEEPVQEPKDQDTVDSADKEDEKQETDG